MEQCLLKKHDLAKEMLRIVNALLQTKGLLLKSATAVDATLISAPSSTKTSAPAKARDCMNWGSGNSQSRQDCVKG